MFTSKSTYLFILNYLNISQVDSYPNIQTNMSWIWKQNVTLESNSSFDKPTQKACQQTKFFLGHCINHNFCPLSQIEPETHLHALRDCNQTKPIWQFLNPSQDFFDKNYKDQLESNIKYNIHSKTNVPWQTIFLYASKSFGYPEIEIFFKIISFPSIQSRMRSSSKPLNFGPFSQALTTLLANL